eukprot:jgi/Psemu1/45626/gm1.45626_g
MNLPESHLKATRIMLSGSFLVVFYEELLTVRSPPTSSKLKNPASSTKQDTQLPANKNDVVRRFKACFGASGTIVADVWNRIVDRGPIESGGEPKHLLWALIHLKVYSTTFSKWAWYFIERIADLKDDVICLGNRFDGLNGIATTNCFISVDGTDCPAYEPWPFSRQMYSHKLNGPGIKYEVGVCLKTGWIVWINGPFVGSANDATIFKEGLSTLLHDDEGVEVDRGYKGDDKMKLPDMGMTSKQRKMKANARAQHETKHGMCFNAVAVITQLKFASGETTFDDGLEYDVNYF